MALIEGALLNDKALLQALDGLPEKLRNRALRQALREEARPIRDEARQIARTISPRLAYSIKLRALKRARKVLGVIIQTGTRAELGIAANDRYYWPAAFEFGTKERFSRGASRGRIAARAFLRGPLFRRRGSMLAKLAATTRRKVEGVIAAEIRRGLNRL